MLTPDNSDLRLPPKKSGDLSSLSEDGKVKQPPPFTRKDFKEVLENNLPLPSVEKKKSKENLPIDFVVDKEDEDDTTIDEDLTSFIALISGNKKEKLPKENDLENLSPPPSENKEDSKISNSKIPEEVVKESPFTVYKQIKTNKDEAKENFTTPSKLDDNPSKVTPTVTSAVTEKNPLVAKDFIPSDKSADKNPLIARDFVPSQELPLKKEEKHLEPYGLAAMSEGDTLPSLSREKKDSKEDKVTTRFQSEESDLSFINPLGTNINVDASLNKGEDVSQIKRPSNIQEIVAEIVKELYTVEKVGHTDTVVILQNPPLFKEAHLVVTSFDTANKELNISFENLTGPAKQVLDENLGALKTLLEDKGYVTHILTTSTEIEHPVYVADSRNEKDEEQSQGQGGYKGEDEEQDQKKRKNK